MNEFGGFILSYNGGEIINWETKEMVYENVLPNEVVPMLYECARTHQLSILTYDGADIITENSQDPYVQKEAFLNKMAVRGNKRLPHRDHASCSQMPHRGRRR